VLRGAQHGWLRYLREVTALVEASASTHDATIDAFALHAAEIVLDHHRMLIGLPGPAYDHVETERGLLDALVADLRTRVAPG
jgi:hypothetical protein